MTLYFEISPLQEANFTGVSVVTERLADHFLRLLGRDVKFFLRNKIVPLEVVEELIDIKTGGHLREFVASLETPLAPEDPDGFSYGLFPNQKTQTGVFSYEAQIVHDFSTVLTPQFHQPATIQLHAPAYRREIWSNDMTFCVSQATADDAALYFDAEAHSKLKVLVEGCDWNPGFEALAARYPYTGEKKYVIVLATLEPRKNIDVLLKLIAAKPSLLEVYDFLFLGRAGWGEGVKQKLGRFGLEDRFGEGVYFPGFVSEFAKYVLLKNAHLVVYPSVFEGFGLPVLEALTLGKHVLTSMSSSIPEVGGDACVYFDPNFPEQFEARFYDAIHIANSDPVNAPGLRQAEKFSWERCAAAIIEDYEQARAAAGTAEGGDV